MNKDLPGINDETVVFSRHARERLDLRRMGEDMIIQVMRAPEKTYKQDDGKIKFVGKDMGAKVHAICKPIPDENKWLVITLWVRGEDDAGNFVNHRKQQAGFSKTNAAIWFLLMLIIAVVYYFSQLA